MERLAETTPTPPQILLEEFNRHFKDEDKSIARPIESNGLQKIVIQRDVSTEIKAPPLSDGSSSEIQWRDNPLAQREGGKREEHQNQVPGSKEGAEGNREGEQDSRTRS